MTAKKEIYFAAIIAGLFMCTSMQAYWLPTTLGYTLESRQTADTVHIDTINSENFNVNAGIAFCNEQAIILSNAKFQQKMLPGHVSFGEDGTYLADPEELNHTPNKLLAAKDPFAHAPAGMAVADDARVIYFTAPENGTRGKDKIFAVPFEKGPSDEKITLSPLYADMLPFCEGNDVYRHPAVAKNDAFLVFASDRKGSMGGFDLFLVQKKGDNWGEPVHLGTEINSVKDELYPFLDSENNLFFSSAGHSGFGGLDLYMSRFSGDGWERPINLMNVINGSGDEFGLKMDAENNTGFFTSIENRGNQQGHMYRLRTVQQGRLSGELLEMAIAAFEEMFGVEFTSTAEQKMTIPQAFELGAVKSEKPTTADKDKAVKEVKEVSPTDPGPQEFVAARKEPAQPEVRKEEKTTRESVETAPEITTEKRDDTTEAAETAEAKNNGVTKPGQTGEPEVNKTQKEEAQTADKDVVTFRVQITSTRSSAAGKKVTIAGKSYTVFEYNYKGAYRQTVGAFRDLDDAKAFQSKCRSAGYSQAFVAAFINDERVTDPAVFKR